MTEIERQALDALVAWRKADRFTYRGSIGWLEDREKFENAVRERDAAADRLIVEREGR